MTNLTHYAYICGPNGMRELTAAMDLSAQSLENRRKLIHACMMNGELLAKAPATEIGWTRETLAQWVATRNVMDDPRR